MSGKDLFWDLFVLEEYTSKDINNMTDVTFKYAHEPLI